MSGYDGDFYKDYERYLLEPDVRKAHWFPLSAAKQESAFDDVVDLGCGCREFQRYVEPWRYIGVDAVHPDADIKSDYRHRSTVNEIVDFCADRDTLHRLCPRAFVSLFSSEITACEEVNYALYRRLFKDISSIRQALVSGFYYDHLKTRRIVEEIPGLFSYQSLDPIETSIERAHGCFTEKRIVIPCPSKMFGEGVVEVWKFFERVYK
jgi:hypothetical protein